MAEAKLAGALSSLEAAAKRLENSSKQTNAILEAVQGRLIELNIGFEFWLHTEPLVDPARSILLEDGQPIPYLGYAKVQGKWGLVVKAFRYSQMGLSYEEPVGLEDPTPLLMASRDQRRHALRVLPRFVESLTVEVDRRVDELDSVAKYFGR